MDALKRKMEIAAVAFFCTVTTLIAAYSCATTAAANLAQQTAAAPATEYVTLAYMEVQPEAEQEPELLYDVPMSDELQRYIREQAERQGVPFEIALAVIERESSYQPDAVSDTGDFGLMQITTSILWSPSRSPRTRRTARTALSALWTLFRRPSRITSRPTSTTTARPATPL